MREILFLLTSTILLVLGCNPCEFDCLNGGECQDGVCECPDEYEGPDCATHKEPIALEFLLVEVSHIPALNAANESWDEDGSAADIVVALRRESGIYNHVTGVQSNTTASSVSLTSSLTLVNNGDHPAYQYFIGVYDKEEGQGSESFELICEYRFNISELGSTTDYVSGLDFTEPGCPSIHLEVEYHY